MKAGEIILGVVLVVFFLGIVSVIGLGIYGFASGAYDKKD